MGQEFFQIPRKVFPLRVVFKVELEELGIRAFRYIPKQWGNRMIDIPSEPI